MSCLVKSTVSNCFTVIYCIFNDKKLIEIRNRQQCSWDNIFQNYDLCASGDTCGSIITAQKASIDGNRTIQQMRMATICLGLIHQGQIGPLIILEGDYLIL